MPESTEEGVSVKTEKGPGATVENSGVIEHEPDPSDGYRRVEVDGNLFKVVTDAEDGHLIEMQPFSFDAQGMVVYEQGVRDESLFARVDKDIAAKYEAKLNDFTRENYVKLDPEGKKKLIENFFTGSDAEITARINRAYSSQGGMGDPYDKAIFNKVGYNKGEFQVGKGWN